MERKRKKKKKGINPLTNSSLYSKPQYKYKTWMIMKEMAFMIGGTKTKHNIQRKSNPLPCQNPEAKNLPGPANGKTNGNDHITRIAVNSDPTESRKSPTMI